MKTVSLVWGLLAVTGMLVGLIPCLGFLNWLNIPFAAIGIIFSAITLGTSKDPDKGGAIAGLSCCFIAVLIGLIRLLLGGFVL